MPALSRAIEGAGYHPEGVSLGFHLEDMSVLMEPRKVTIIGADTELKAHTVMDWIREKVGIT
jgi:hypothetical protein